MSSNSPIKNQRNQKSLERKISENNHSHTINKQTKDNLPLFLRKNSGSNACGNNINQIQCDSAFGKFSIPKKNVKSSNQRSSEEVNFNSNNYKNLNKLFEKEKSSASDKPIQLSNSNYVSYSFSNSNPVSCGSAKGNLEEKPISQQNPVKRFSSEEDLISLSTNKYVKDSIKNTSNSNFNNVSSNNNYFGSNLLGGSNHFFEYDLTKDKNNNLFNTSSSRTRSESNLVINRFNEKQRQSILLAKANLNTLENEESESSIFNNDQIKKFNSWNNSSNTNANKLISSNNFDNKNNNNKVRSIFNSDDLSDQNHLALFNSTNSVVLNRESLDKFFINKQIGSQNLLSSDKKSQIQLLNNMNVTMKSKNKSPNLTQELNNTPSNNKTFSASCSDNNSNSNNNINNFYYNNSNNPLFNAEAKASSKFQIGAEEENTDYEANFALAAKFITNNKKIPMTPSMLNSKEKYSFINNNNKKPELNSFQFQEAASLENKSIYSIEKNQKRYSIDNILNNVKPNNLIPSKNCELNAFNQNDFLKKFNTSDAVRPARIYLEMNDLAAASNSDQHLLVTAEMEKTNKNLNSNRISESNNFMSNYKSNKSTSNDDSKEFGSNANLLNFNSNASNNNNNNNHNNFNMNLNYFNCSNNNNNDYNNSNQYSKRNFNNFDSNKKNKNLLEEKEFNLNLDPQLSKFNSQNNSNYRSSNSNSNLSFKTKQSQKNQIFFPVEISVKSFNSANSVNNSSKKTVSDFACKENAIQFNKPNNVDNHSNNSLSKMKSDKNSN